MYNIQLHTRMYVGCTNVQTKLIYNRKSTMYVEKS
jgi:hypothetical protein